MTRVVAARTAAEGQIMTEEVDWLVGVDWATESHQVCLLDRNGKSVGERAFAHGGDGLAELCAWLLTKTGAQPNTIAVSIEVPHGPVVEALLERGFQVYAINPKQLDRFRDRFSVAGAKDDRRDAHVLADSLRTDLHAFRRLSIDNPLVVELREWSRMTDDLQRERGRLANRVREQLWRYYPQMLELTGDLWADWLLELWARVPTPAKAAQVRRSTIDGILKAHRIRRIDGATVLASLTTTPLPVAPGVVEAATAHIQVVATRLKLVNQQMKAAHRRLDELCAKLASGQEDEPGQICEQRDVTILRSMPGLGRIILAVLLAEASEPLRRRDYHALRTLSGVAPVTKRSGKLLLVVRRYACNKRLENALYHWARVASQVEPVSRARYAELRRKGHSHGRALRGLADRLLSLACTLLDHQVLFDPEHRARQADSAAA